MGLFGFGKKKEDVSVVENTAQAAADLATEMREAWKRKDGGEIKEVTDHAPLASVLYRMLTCQFCSHEFRMGAGLRKGSDSNLPNQQLVIKCPSCSKDVFSMMS